MKQYQEKVVLTIAVAKTEPQVEELVKNGQFKLHISTLELQLIQNMLERA
jgi:hypothetical protein